MAPRSIGGSSICLRCSSSSSSNSRLHFRFDLSFLLLQFSKRFHKLFTSTCNDKISDHQITL